MSRGKDFPRNGSRVSSPGARVPACQSACLPRTRGIILKMHNENAWVRKHQRLLGRDLEGPQRGDHVKVMFIDIEGILAKELLATRGELIPPSRRAKHHAKRPRATAIHGNQQPAVSRHGSGRDSGRGLWSGCTCGSLVAPVRPCSKVPNLSLRPGRVVDGEWLAGSS